LTRERRHGILPPAFPRFFLLQKVYAFSGLKSNPSRCHSGRIFFSLKIILVLKKFFTGGQWKLLTYATCCFVLYTAINKSVPRKFALAVLAFLLLSGIGTLLDSKTASWLFEVAKKLL